MYNFKINKIETNDGTPIIPKALNILIGPNNCGKSQFLKDIKNILQNNFPHKDSSVIVKNMEYELPKNIKDFLERYKLEELIFQSVHGQLFIRNFSGIKNYSFEFDTSLNNYLDAGNISLSHTWKDELNSYIESFRKDLIFEDEALKNLDLPNNAIVYEERYMMIEGRRKDLSGDSYPITVLSGKSITPFINTYGSLFVNYLGTEEKLLLCKKQRNYGYEDHTTNFLSEVQRNAFLINSLAVYTKKLFNKDIFLDRYTLGSSLQFRVGENFDFIRQSRREHTEVEIKLKEYGFLDDEGDGLKSFVTNYLSLNMGKKSILLLDEPESFLHPPLARQLGEIIGESSSNEKQIFVATHSVELLKGILSKNSEDVNIIRITRPQDKQNAFNIIKSNLLNNILNNPLLRVSRVMEGLFCEKVIITESEADELIYQELIEKLFPQSGLYFAHAQNKQTLADIASLYKDIGIDYEIVGDFDILRIPKELNNFLSLMSLNEIEKQEIIKQCEQWRESVNESAEIDVSMLPEEKEKIKKQCRNEVYHKQGISYFSEETQKEIKKLLNKLRNHHLHIWSNGELETLLVEYGVIYRSDKKIG